MHPRTRIVTTYAPSLRALQQALTYISNTGQGHLVREASRTYTMRTTVGRTPLDEGSVLPRDLYPKTQHSKETDIYAPGGI